MAKKKNNLIQMTLPDVVAPARECPKENRIADKTLTPTALHFTIILKVKLFHQKRIWRSIEFRSNHTLEVVHKAIFRAFDRDDPHMYSFYFPESPSKSTRIISQAKEYTVDENIDSFFSRKKKRKASSAKLKDIVLYNGQKFYYLFDFGDDWWHEIEVVSMCEGIVGNKSPTILDKRGESPSQYNFDDDE